MTVYSLGSPAVAPERTRGGRWRMLLVMLICASPVVASYVTYFFIRPAAHSVVYGSLITPTLAMPDVVGIDLDGKPLALRSLKGPWLLVVVGSGRCDAACEGRLFFQRQLREMTGKERERVKKLWLITDDVELTPALRSALLASPAMQVLRLPRATVAAWLHADPGGELEDHLYIVDPMGEWMMRSPRDPDPRKMLANLDRLLRASASWHRVGD
jgi:hypothetical protein